MENKIVIAAVALCVGITLALFFCCSTIAHLRRRLRYTRKPKEEKSGESRKPMEFKKRLAAWAATLATLAFVLSYVLAFFDKQTVSDVTNTVFTACIGYLISYAAASLGEKASRNKHGLDADGNPIPTKNNTTAVTPEKVPEPSDVGGA